jgi:nickel-dependent lactate racemase
VKEIYLKSNNNEGITDEELIAALKRSITERKTNLKKVLLLPPDFTRMHSGAGKITALYYALLKDRCKVDVMPALGTHEPMSENEIKTFFPGIPLENFLVHNWRADVVKIGEVPGEYVAAVSDHLSQDPIDVEVNEKILDKSYDLIISIGQVVPHEVVGMSNYSKNIFVGCGGSSMINQSHMLGAFYGLERIMGKDLSPVRKVFDYAEKNFLRDIPLIYVLTVTTLFKGIVSINGIFIGKERGLFEEAVKLSQEKNIIFVDKPLKKVIVYLDGREFKSTWLGNKAVYRTRMAIADGGELIILAPGVKKFGEDATNDRVIRKYGYVGRQQVLELCKSNSDLMDNLSVAAHLIHGSSDGRFSITYAVDKLTREEIEDANFKYMPLDEGFKLYNIDKLREGYNVLENGEEIFYISNPALGLWASHDKFYQAGE